MSNECADELPEFEIRVVPDETAPEPEPLVLLSDRELHIPAETKTAKILWKKLPASKKFKMISLTDNTASGNVFQDIVISGNQKRVTCTFVRPEGDPPDEEYEYTLTIKYKGKLLNTDRRTGPHHGRPVIRN